MAWVAQVRGLAAPGRGRAPPNEQRAPRSTANWNTQSEGTNRQVTEAPRQTLSFLPLAEVRNGGTGDPAVHDLEARAVNGRAPRPANPDTVEVGSAIRRLPRGLLCRQQCRSISRVFKGGSETCFWFEERH